MATGEPRGDSDSQEARDHRARHDKADSGAYARALAPCQRATADAAGRLAASAAQNATNPASTRASAALAAATPPEGSSLVVASVSSNVLAASTRRLRTSTSCAV